MNTENWPANWQELISHPEFIPEPSAAALLALACTIILAIHFWPLCREGLARLAALFIILPLLLICLGGGLAALVGWHWLENKCAAALTDTDGQTES